MIEDAVESPRPEYPRPQFERDEWLNLNGIWDFEFDPGDSGMERGLLTADLAEKILVPFAPESKMSGIGDVDFHEAVWYRRMVEIPRAWAGKRLLLHFGAVDHDATVFVNGVEVMRHRGGFTSFSVDVTDASGGMDFELRVRARDTRHAFQARGKQATWYENSECFYTRTTGIWQTVWIEPVEEMYLERVDITPDVAGSRFELRVGICENMTGYTIRAKMLDQESQKILATAVVPADLGLNPLMSLVIPDDEKHLWNPGDAYLYHFTFEICDAQGRVVDHVRSYAGLRSVEIQGKQFLINGRPVFQRLVLDQGYWSDSLMTAPSDEALVRDIELGLAAGFNGARLHQKVFEERYLYHADRLGYIVWGEFADWGISTGLGPKGNNQHPKASFITQWAEAVQRDYSHPSIVGWCPMNETWQVLTDYITELDDVMHGMFLVTKALDSTRPVLDSSGYSHRVAQTDVYDSHNYEQDPTCFSRQVGDEAHVYENKVGNAIMSQHYAGQPYFVSEYGGIWWNARLAAGTQKTDSDSDGGTGNVPNGEALNDSGGEEPGASWGYGSRVKNLEEFYARFEGLTEALTRQEWMFGYCYTQLTDVFQEQNGIYDFERKEKFDTRRIRKIQLDLAQKYQREC